MKNDSICEYLMIHEIQQQHTSYEKWDQMLKGVECGIAIRIL